MGDSLGAMRTSRPGMHPVSQDSDASETEYDDSGSDSDEEGARRFDSIDQSVVDRWDKTLEVLREQQAHEDHELNWLLAKNAKIEEKKSLLEHEIKEVEGSLKEIENPAVLS